MDPAPPPRPVTLTDLPAELLGLVFAAVFQAAAPTPPGSAVLHPTATDELPPAPSVGAAGWAAAAGAAGACRALRDAFRAAVTVMEVDPARNAARVAHDADAAGRRGCDGWIVHRRDVDHARTTERVGELGGLLGRLSGLRALHVRLDGLTEVAAVAATAAVVGALTAPAGPLLVALSIVVHPYVPLPAGLGLLAAAQSRLLHLVLLLPTAEEPRTYPRTRAVGQAPPAAAAEAAGVVASLAPRLRSLDLKVLSLALGLLSGEAVAVAWLGRLPMLPAVRFVRLLEPTTAAVLAATARVCPAARTLCLNALPTFMNNDGGAEAVVRLFPHMVRLAVGDPYQGYRNVSAAFVAGVVRRRALHTLAMCGLRFRLWERRERLVDALRDACALPSHLRYEASLSPNEVLELTEGGLPGVVGLHMASDMTVYSAVSLGRCTSLRSLCIRGHDYPGFCVSEAVAAALVPPGVAHLTLVQMGFGSTAAEVLVAAAARAMPATLQSLSLVSCSGEVAGALLAAAGVPTLRRLTIVDHLMGTTRPFAQNEPPVREVCADQLALLAVRRPDVVFVD